MFKHEYILVTGAAGSIGSELVRQLVDDNFVCALDSNETELFDLVEELRLDGKNIEYRVGDICNVRTLEEITSRSFPSLIFHAAARKHVTPSEQNPIEAVDTNIYGLQNIINLAVKRGSRLVNISTDKAVNPTSVMGMTKRIGEIMVKNAGFVSVRFANVLGSRGSVIPIWQKQIDEGKPLTITDPQMERYFMTIPQATGLVLKAAEIGESGDIIVLDMGTPLKLLDIATKIIEASGKNVGIREIGSRPGESLQETLMTDKEELKAKKLDGLWIIK